METNVSTSVLHTSDSRGKADHGWLQSRHSFSFANYYNPERVGFGGLLVLNDDFVAPGMGFGLHPHRDMEIISIPLEGDLEHKDNMGNAEIIAQGDVQVMSAGTGVFHSEYNASKTDPVKFLQIWITPDTKGVTPRYDQVTLDVSERENKFQQIISPNSDDAGMWIHQQAWLNMGNFEAGKGAEYKLHNSGSGVYAFVLEGEVSINGQTVGRRDALGIWDVDSIEVEATSDAEVLLIEVPMDAGWE